MRRKCIIELRVCLYPQQKQAIINAKKGVKEMINAGIIGFGIVGSGTAKVLLENKDILRERLGFDLNLKRIADLDITTDRGVTIPGGVLTTDVNDIFNDPDIQIVVELIGGIRPAKDFILKAIEMGKHAVTAN